MFADVFRNRINETLPVHLDALKQDERNEPKTRVALKACAELIQDGQQCSY
jgi:hypothetical protein